MHTSCMFAYKPSAWHTVHCPITGIMPNGLRSCKQQCSTSKGYDILSTDNLGIENCTYMYSPCTSSKVRAAVYTCSRFSSGGNSFIGKS